MPVDTMFGAFRETIFQLNVLGFGSDIIIILMISAFAVLFTKSGRSFAMSYITLFAFFTIMGWIRVPWLGAIVALLCGIYLIATEVKGK